MDKITWKIGRAGRAWQGEEAAARHNLLPEPTRIELHQGKLFWNDEERLCVVGMLLENLGLDKVIPLIDPDLLLEALFVHEVGEDKLNEMLDMLNKLK